MFKEAGPGNLLYQPFQQGLFRQGCTGMLSLPDGSSSAAGEMCSSCSVTLSSHLLWCCFAASVEVLPFAAALGCLVVYCWGEERTE